MSQKPKYTAGQIIACLIGEEGCQPNIHNVVIGTIESVSHSNKWGIEYFVRWADRPHDEPMNLNERDTNEMYALLQTLRQIENF